MSAFEGSLESTPLADILKKIAMKRQEGLLTLSWKENRVFAHCKDGEVVRAWEGEEEVLLGELLVRAGKMTPERLENGLRIQKNINQSLTLTMVEMGYVTPEEIKRLTRILSEETLYPVFNWPTGRFNFAPKEVVFDPELIGPLPTDLIIREGNRQADAWPDLLEKIPSRHLIFEQTRKGGEDVEGSISHFEEKYEATQVILERTIKHLKMEEGHVESGKDELSWLTGLIDGKRTVQEIIKKSETMAFSAFSVYSGLCELLEREVIKVRHEILDETAGLESKTVTIQRTPEPPLIAENEKIQGIDNTKEIVEVLGKDDVQAPAEPIIKKITDKIRLPDAGSILSSISTGNWAVNGIAIAASVLLIFIAYPSILRISNVGHQIKEAFAPITRSSEQDGIRIALDLYYLKYMEFPNSLNDLIRDGFLVGRRVDPSNWKYRADQNGYVLSESNGQVVIQE